MKKALFAVTAMVLATTAWAHAEHEGHAKPAESTQKEVAVPLPAPAAKPGGAQDARAYFTDTELLTQDGRKVRFYSDVLADKVVLINVIYTNCPDACPLITKKLNEVRAQVEEQFGKEVFFVSISSDPVRDTPARLKAFAQKNQADIPGWTFLTGKKQNVDQILKKLGQWSENVEGHSTLLIAGNVPKKRWTKIRPDAPPLAIGERLKLLAEGTPPAGALLPKAN